eukprot:75674-Prymnesium_polylepis.1
MLPALILPARWHSELTLPVFIFVWFLPCDLPSNRCRQPLEARSPRGGHLRGRRRAELQRTVSTRR